METLARPYARAVFATAQEHKNADYWFRLLDALAQMLQTREFAAAVKDPTRSADSKLEFITKLLSELQVQADDQAKNLLLLLLARRRLALAPAIRDLFAEMWQATGNKLEVKVTTAYELSGEEKQMLTEKLSIMTGRQPELSETVDQALIGGVILEWDGRTLDASIRGKLAKLNASL